MPLDDPWLTGETLQDTAVVEVFRLNDDGELDALPNVECLSIRQGEGPDPGSAMFRYNLAYEGGPESIEGALDPANTGSLIVEPGDNIVVKATAPTGHWEYLFDGFVLAFSLGLAEGTEEVQIEAEGIARRLWDRPIGGAVHRWPNYPTTTDDTHNIETDLPVHFNQDGQPNCTPEESDCEVAPDSELTYPTFLLFSGYGEDRRRYWDLDGAVRYLLYTLNDEEWVLNPTPDETAILSDTGPPEDSLIPVPSRAPLIVPNLPVTGKDLPTTVFDLVREYGFGMRFVIDSASSTPETRIEFYHHQSGELKSIDLPRRGSDFDPYTCNIGQASIRRSLSEVVNEYEVWGRPARYEVSFVLYPAFPMNSADGSAANLKNYDRNGSSFVGTNRDAYRLFVAAEDSSPYYANGTSTVLTGYTDFSEIFVPDTDDAFLPRRRPPIGQLFTKGPDGRPLKASLHISTDYGGNHPFDGLGTWQPVVTNSWQLLKDRIGIYITDPNPNAWDVGQSNVSGHPFRSGRVRVVEALSGSEATIPDFLLLLTCVVESDYRLKVRAERQDVSPLSNVIVRQIDARDRYFFDIITTQSIYNTSGDQVVVRDDREDATKEAEARREAAALGVIDGVVTIPYLTNYYRVGDRIEKINGRNLAFLTGGSIDGEDGPNYPVVTGITHSFGPGSQTTTLQLSDSGAARFKYARKAVRLGLDS